MGDFNSQPWSIPVALLRGYGGLRDSFVEAHPQANDPPANVTAVQALESVGMTCDSPLNTWSQGKPIPPTVTAAGGKRLDYIFYTPPLAHGSEHSQRHLRCSHSKVVLTEHVPGREMSLSDHFGLTSTFVLSDEAHNPTPASQAPLLLDSESESSVIPPTAGGSVYELHRADSGSDSAIRAALTALRAYGRLARGRTLRFSAIVLACIVAVVGLTVGSAWQPKPWIQPIFTLLAFALGAFGATMLYAGWLWGRWEKGLLDEVTSEMEEALRASEERR
jgi:sphingomyelin phosphodiesterase 2